MKTTCIICGVDFQKKVNNQKCCSMECSKVNNRKLKKESHSRLYDKKHQELVTLSNKWRIPIRFITQYGISFLEENPIVVEALQIQVKLGGHFTFLTDEEKAIRRKATMRQANCKAREKTAFKSIVCCSICNKEFVRGKDRPNNSVTCSVECSSERDRRQTNEAGARQRNKKRVIKPYLLDIENKCLCCDSTFNPSKYNKDQKFCKSCKDTYNSTFLSRKFCNTK